MYSKKSYVFCFSILTVFGVKMTSHAGLTAKLKFEDMAKQINNFKKTRRHRLIECANFFSKFQLGKELLSFDF